MTNTEEQQLTEEIEKIIDEYAGIVDADSAFFVEPETKKRYTDQILSLFQSHEAQIKQDLFKKVEKYVIGYDDMDRLTAIYNGAPIHSDWQERNQLRQELRASLKALEEKEIGK